MEHGPAIFTVRPEPWTVAFVAFVHSDFLMAGVATALTKNPTKTNLVTVLADLGAIVEQQVGLKPQKLAFRHSITLRVRETLGKQFEQPPVGLTLLGVRQMGAQG